MGMFDYIRVEGHEVPGLETRLVEEGQDRSESLVGELAVFQTKDMDNCLSVYVIKYGRLFERIYETEEILEEEARYGRSGDNLPSSRVPRRRRTGSYEDEDTGYHGDLRFYAVREDLGLADEPGSGLLEFRARFTHGDLEWIRPAEENG